MPATGTPPLGLRYTVLKLAADNTPTEVPNDTVFHAGDRIRFSVETNGPGYLYIISQGSSGTWKPMFPSPEIDDGSNRVEGWHTYTMPPKSRLVFDEQTGTEKIFIVFSRSPSRTWKTSSTRCKAKQAAAASTPEAPVQSCQRADRGASTSTTPPWAACAIPTRAT